VPFESEAQRKYLFATHPEIARRWAKLTPKSKKLPKHKRKEAKKKSGSALHKKPRRLMARRKSGRKS
jgi:hypothetical protein